MNLAADLKNIPKISVIIPVYNSEEYLKECLESVLNQSLKNIEVILIDDGSKDHSSKICDEYSQRDKRVIVIHQENKGICGARNAGLKMARGEYVAFCDNDDFVSHNCYELAYEKAKKINADVVRFRRKHTMIGRMGRITTSYPDYTNHVVEIKDWKDYLEIISKTGYGIWAGIYRNSIISSNLLEFDTRVKYGYEDNIFSGNIYRFVETVYLMNDELYEWIQRISHSASMKKGYDIFLNRVEGMIIWKKAEDLLFESISDTRNLHKTRIYDYMRMVIEEIKNSGIRGKEKERAIIYAKEKLNFATKNGNTLEERLINNNYIELFMLNRYFKIAKRKFRQVVQKLVGNRR